MDMTEDELNLWRHLWYSHSDIAYADLSDEDKQRVRPSECAEDMITGERLISFCEVCMSKSREYEPEKWGFEKEHTIVLDAGVIALCKTCDKYEHVYGLELESRVRIDNSVAHAPSRYTPGRIFVDEQKKVNELLLAAFDKWCQKKRTELKQML